MQGILISSPAIRMYSSCSRKTYGGNRSPKMGGKYVSVGIEAHLAEFAVNL